MTRIRCSRHQQALDGPCVRCHEEQQMRDYHRRKGQYENQERIAGPLLLAATKEPLQLLDVIEQGSPVPWRKGTVVGISNEDFDGTVRPIYTVQWRVVGEIPPDIYRL